MTLLASRLEEVNAMALAGDLPDVDISDKGVKSLRWRTAFLQVFRPCGFGLWHAPHPKITEILEEVDSWTGFTRHFAHLKNNNVRPKDGRLLLTTILADGINLGLTKMAESCPGATRSSLKVFRHGTSEMKLIQRHWPSWSTLRKRDLWPHSGATGQHRRQTGRTFG
jgi:hypothetical protein